MSPPRERVLKRVPFLRLSLNSRNEVQAYAAGRLVSCGPAALRVLELFAEARPLPAALRQLTEGAAPAERAAVISTVLYLLESGVLMDVTAPAGGGDDSPATDDGPRPDGVGEDGAAALTLNPTVELSLELRLRGAGGEAASHRLDAGEQPELCKALVGIASGDWHAGDARSASPDLAQHLARLGVLVPRDEASDEVHFECFLDDPPEDFIPRRARELARPPAGGTEGLVLACGLWLQRGDDPPDELTGRVPFRDRFSRAGGAILWVEDAATKALAPLWLRGHSAGLVAELLAGRAPARSLGGRDLEVLALAGALVPTGYEEARRAWWRAECARLRAELEGQGYAVLRDLVGPLQLAALRRYFRALDAKAYLKDSSNRHYARNRRTLAGEETARFVHRQIAGAVNEIVPAPVAPTHATLSVYKPGALLKRHTDIDKCEWNVSLLVDTEPEADLAAAWPLKFEVGGREAEARLGMGDAVLYSGRRTPHWREELPAGREETLIFFCFA